MGKELITVYDDEAVINAESDKEYVEEIRTNFHSLMIWLLI
jgi:hypothetical protein